MKNQSFLKGAVILMAANIVSKVLGAIFKIPLAYIIKEEGMAVFNTAFQIYIMVLSFAVCGFPLAISKNIAEKTALQDEGGIHKFMKTATMILLVLGVMGSAVMYFGAEFFSYALKEPKAVFAVKMIAPSIFFVAWGTAYKSYFQGGSNMIPTALSQVVESCVKLAAGYGLAVYLIKVSVSAAAGGAALSVTIGEIIATFILWGMFLVDKKKCTVTPKEFKQITNSIFSIVFPILLTCLLSNLLSLIDISVIRLRLTQCQFDMKEAAAFLQIYGPHTDLFFKNGGVEISTEGAGWLYGAYSGYAMTVFNLPVGILATFEVSILPVIAGSIASNNLDAARKKVNGVFRIISFAAFPCALFVAYMSKEILQVLFHNSASHVLLSCLAPSIAILCLTQAAGVIMNSSGKIFLPFLIGFSGMLLKTVLQWFLIADGKFNMAGAPVAFFISAVPVMTLNLLSVKKFIGLKFEYRDIIIKPAVSSVIMVIVLRYANGWIYAKTAGITALFAAFLFASAVYLGVQFLIGGIRKEDMKLMKTK